jgi:hypothetical protein
MAIKLYCAIKYTCLNVIVGHLDRLTTMNKQTKNPNYFLFLKRINFYRMVKHLLI